MAGSVVVASIAQCTDTVPPSVLSDAVFGGICRQFVQYQREALGGSWIEKDLGPVNGNPCPKAFQCIFNHLPHQRPAAGSLDDQILCLRQSMQPIKKCLSSVAFLQAGGGDGLDDRKEIFGAMLQFRASKSLRSSTSRAPYCRRRERNAALTTLTRVVGWKGLSTKVTLPKHLVIE